jgi:hypothetical protein
MPIHVQKTVKIAEASLLDKLLFEKADQITVIPRK